MILGISHLVLSSGNMEEDGKSLKSLGYKRVFTQKKIINPEIKQPVEKLYNSF